MPPSRASAAADAAGSDDLINIRGVIATLWRAKYIVLGIALAAAIVAAMAMFRMTSVYTARSEVQLTRTSSQVTAITNIVESRALGESDILSEIAVMTSPRILYRVAERLDLARHEEFSQSAGLLAPVLSMVRSTMRAFIRATDATVDEPKTPNQIAAGYLADKINVRQSGLSYILLIDATSENAQRAARIADAIAEEYLAQQVEDRLAAARRATDWLHDRVADLLTQLETAESAVQESRIAAANAGGASPTIISGQIADLSSLLVSAKVAEAEAQERLAQFDALIVDGEFTAAAQIVDSPTLRSAGEQLETLRRQIGTLGARSTDPDVLQRLGRSEIDTRDSVAGVAANISRGLRAAVDIAAGKVAAIQSAISGLEVELGTALGRTRELRARESQLETIQSVYQTFLTRLTETEERGGFQAPNGRINANATVPTAPSAPRRAQLVILCFVLTAAIASAVVLALDMRRDGFKTDRQAARATGLPVLAALPLEARHSRESDEELRRLYAALWNVGPESRRRVIAVSSALPGEGSADIARRLATLAAADGKTLLLRADALSRGAGASVDGCDVLSMSDLLVAGRGVGAPARPALVLAALRDRYDTVIVDAPPVLASADILELSAESDAVVFAVRWSHTPRGAVTAALDRLAAVGATVTGLALTQTDARAAAAFGYAGEIYARRSLARRWRTA